MFSHLLNPSKTVSFVKASNHSDSFTQEPSTSTLNGDEVRSAYEEIVSSSSNSGPCQSRREKPNVVKRKEGNKRNHESTQPLNERDDRLFLKAAAQNDVDTLRNYIKRKINLEVADMFGWTALMCAAAAGSKEVVKELLNVPWHPQSRCAREKAVEVARKAGKTDIALYIESFEMKPNVSDDNVPSSSARLIEIVSEETRPDKGYAYGIPISNPGYRMLKKGGWMEEHGLGRLGDGRQYPIRTMLKRDRKGLDHVKSAEMKVTHFKSMDLASITSAKVGKRSYIKGLYSKIEQEKSNIERLRKMLR